ncbi:hypothetical protein P280DRAFT_199055 [Massarina eburnea CBS 473.64]|uniref:Uncharacterized protein n=1 Tax=Massarina eburnea CBS 473.64 TaxID=1395130 RepID=A0A6A6RIX6_9PLEO|nr:hypothetical protein P280DRAFT_199055 [Massarina eburnea CBS 473.64]
MGVLDTKSRIFAAYRGIAPACTTALQHYRAKDTRIRPTMCVDRLHFHAPRSMRLTPLAVLRLLFTEWVVSASRGPLPQQPNTTWSLASRMYTKPTIPLKIHGRWRARRHKTARAYHIATSGNYTYDISTRRSDLYPCHYSSASTIFSEPALTLTLVWEVEQEVDEWWAGARLGLYRTRTTHSAKSTVPQ